MRYPDLDIVPLVGDFSQALELPQALDETPKVGFFPGSTIGNLDAGAAQALLRNAREWPNVQGFILGVDLVKDLGELVAAYDDAQGVTARFIGNILVRLNREADANFDPEAFSYHARWNEDAARIDMLLVSDRRQVVDLPGARIEFDAGEPIHVSSSRKFTPTSLAELVSSAGWKLDNTLMDAGERLAVAFLTPA